MTTPRSRTGDTDSTQADSTQADSTQADSTQADSTQADSTQADFERRDPAEKPVEQWTTGDEPMTGPQRSYLHTLAQEAGEDLPEAELTKAEASELIERLQRVTGRIPADRSR
jgi:uncharacterized protein YjbI with pentapeptide repeats